MIRRSPLPAHAPTHVQPYCPGDRAAHYSEHPLLAKGYDEYSSPRGLIIFSPVRRLP
jgi:hypothetical protein